MPTTPTAPRRPGFALLWAIVMIAVAATILAMLAPSLQGANDMSRYAATGAIMRTMGTGVKNFQVAIQDGNGKHNYPGQLSELANVIVTGNVNSCNAAMTTTVSGKMNNSDSLSWTVGGPFVTFYVPSDGLMTPLGRIRDSIPNRASPAGTTPIYMEIPGVSSSDANGFDFYIDNGTGDSVSTLHAPVNDTTTLRIRLIAAAVNNIC